MDQDAEIFGGHYFITPDFFHWIPKVLNVTVTFFIGDLNRDFSEDSDQSKNKYANRIKSFKYWLKQKSFLDTTLKTQKTKSKIGKLGYIKQKLL